MYFLFLSSFVDIKAQALNFYYITFYFVVFCF